jgi:hypothetical protein
MTVEAFIKGRFRGYFGMIRRSLQGLAKQMRGHCRGWQSAKEQQHSVLIGCRFGNTGSGRIVEGSGAREQTFVYAMDTL